MDPGKATRPSFPSNQTSNSAANLTSSAPSSGPESMSRGVKTGIGAGIVGGIILIIFAVAIFVWSRKRRSKIGESHHGMIKLAELDSHHVLPQLEANESKVEMSTNSQHELPQLETKESPVELPAGHVFHHHEIGRAF